MDCQGSRVQGDVMSGQHGTATVWINGESQTVEICDIIPWICGASGSSASVDIAVRDLVVTVDMDSPSASGGRRVVYIVEHAGTRHRLLEGWVLPWIRGVAASNGVWEEGDHDQTASGRSQRLAALMRGHQRGWFEYVGFEFERGAND